jgi:butyryl-CoA dehydrogenase
LLISIEMDFKKLVSELTNKVRTEQSKDITGRTLELLKDYGLFGILVPKGFGGFGGNIVDTTYIIEAISRVCPSAGAIFMFHNQVVKRILEFGSEDQKRKYLPYIATGDIIGASSWSELNAGADKQGLKSYAVKENGFYKLNGNKAFCTGAELADLYTILVRTGTQPGRELSFLIVEKAQTGLSFGDNWDGMGMCGSSTKEIKCKDCLIPSDNLIGQEGQGTALMSSNRKVALHPGIIGLGICKEAISLFKHEVNEKERLWDFQNTRMQLADIVTQVEALHELVYKAAHLADKNEIRSEDISLKAKIMGANVSNQVTSIILQLFGANGYRIGFGIEKLLRDSHALGIMGPTTELCKEFVSKIWFAEEETYA